MTRKQVSREKRKPTKAVGRITPKTVAAHRLLVLLCTPSRSEAMAENARGKEELKFIGLSRNRALCTLQHRGSGEAYPMKGGPEFTAAEEKGLLEGGFWMRLPELLGLLDHNPEFFELDPDGDDEATIRHLLRDLVGRPEPKEERTMSSWIESRELLALPAPPPRRYRRGSVPFRRRFPAAPLGREARKAVLDGDWRLEGRLLAELGKKPWQDIDRRLLMELVDIKDYDREDFDRRVGFVLKAIRHRGKELDLSTRYVRELTGELEWIISTKAWPYSSAVARGLAQEALDELKWLDDPMPTVAVEGPKFEVAVDDVNECTDTPVRNPFRQRRTHAKSTGPEKGKRLSLGERTRRRLLAAALKFRKAFSRSKPDGYTSFLRWAGRSVAFMAAAMAFACLVGLVALHVTTGLPCLFVESKKGRRRLRQTWKRLWMKAAEAGEKIFSQADRILK